jgi:hypothetical protein
MQAVRKLTIEQRARRRATRKNNDVRRAYPLLAQAGVINDWMTTEEQARADLERIDQGAAEQMARLREAREANSREAERIRAQVAGQTDAETMALLDSYLARVYPRDYALGFWERVLAGEFDIHATLAKIEQAREAGERARAAADVAFR